MLSRSLPAMLSASYFHGFLSIQHAVSLPPSEALRKLLARFPVRPACCLAPSQRNFPQTISTASHPSSMLPRSLPAKLSASYFYGFLSVQHAVSLPPSEAVRKLFGRFPLRPACCLAPSQRSSPQAISTVSCPPSMLSRSLPTKLSPNYFHGFRSVQHAVWLPPSEALRNLFARFPIRPACCLAPCQRSSPQAICTVSCPSSMLSRSFLAKISPSYFHVFVSVQHAVSLPPSEALRKRFPRLPLHPTCCIVPSHAASLPPGEAPRKLFPRFPIRPACCLAPSRRRSPRAICMVSCPSNMLYRSVPCCIAPSRRSPPGEALRKHFHGFLSVQHAVSLPPGADFRKLFARFPVRPACCLAPSQRNFPHAVSLLPSEALRHQFARSPIRPACCLAPCQRSSPRAICTWMARGVAKFYNVLQKL